MSNVATVTLVVHLGNDAAPDRVLHERSASALSNPGDLSADISFRFQGVFLSKDNFKHRDNALSYMVLDQYEVFITLILEDFRKQLDLMVLLHVCTDSIDNCSSPLNDERLQTVFMD